jgi:hypothetical protein
MRFLGSAALVALTAPLFAVSAERTVVLSGLSEGFVAPSC